VACLDGLNQDDLDWRPIASANSLHVLATHIFGVLEQNLLGILGGQSVQRDRDAEFVAKASSAEPVQKRWNELKERIPSSLAKLSSTALSRKYSHPRRDSLLTGREILVMVTRHAAEHLGHAELTRDLLKARRG